MSSAATIQNGGLPGRDRRGGPRESVQQAILVFFGENNWGKLIDLGQGGMSFEFSQAPPLRERIDFKLETMGCAASHPEGHHVNNSFGLAGEVVWTRQFERSAGVRFLDLPENSRQQIQNFVSFEKSIGAATPDEAAASEVFVPENEPTGSAEPPVSPAEAPGGEGGESTQSEAEEAESWAPPVQDFDSEEIRQILDSPAFDAYKKLRIDGPTQSPDVLGSRSRAVRTGLIAVFGLLAILATIAVATRIPARWVRRAQAVEQVPILLTPAYQGQLGGSKSRPSSAGSQPFMVEVSEASDKKWLLWFDHNLPKGLPVQMASKATLPSSPAEPKNKAIGHEQVSAAERSVAPNVHRRIKPQWSHPNPSVPTHSAADAPPIIPEGVAAPSIESAAGILTRAEAPAPIVRNASGGAKVEPARLLKSVPPAYPELARSMGVAGDVTLDALIDTDGNVRDVKALSGPALLQQAARGAVRLWKYEPARLGGRPVPMHLTVTVKFSSR